MWHDISTLSPATRVPTRHLIVRHIAPPRLKFAILDRIVQSLHYQLLKNKKPLISAPACNGINGTKINGSFTVAGDLRLLKDKYQI